MNSQGNAHQSFKLYATAVIECEDVIHDFYVCIHKKHIRIIWFGSYFCMKIYKVYLCE